MKKIFYLLALIGGVWSQDTLNLSKNQLNTARDINGAIDIQHYEYVIMDSSSDGNGSFTELESGNYKTKKLFPKENNTTWFKIEVGVKSNCSFEIQPHNAKDDYDFILLSGKEGVIKESNVLRSNLARPNNTNGFTGLKEKQKEQFVGPGVGNNYSSVITLEPNEVYYLVLNNVKGVQGATIVWNKQSVFNLKGQVRNDEGEAISAKLSWQEADADEPQEVFTTDESGFYDVNLRYEEKNNKSYVLTVESDSSFFSQEQFNSQDLNQDKEQDYVLISLSPGKKLDLTTVYFKGGLAEFEKFALPTLEALHQLMFENPTLEILIVGHVNGCQADNASQLSSDRAAVTKIYLESKGIQSNRMETQGKSCKEMLHPLGSKEDWKNRRIEIIVQKF